MTNKLGITRFGCPVSDAEAMADPNFQPIMETKKPEELDRLVERAQRSIERKARRQKLAERETEDPMSGSWMTDGEEFGQ